jgi:1-acyl-sn-glycerol-3-phosphate acyltransferase
MWPFAPNTLAAAALGLLGLALVVWLVLWIRRMPFTPLQSVLFGLNYVFARVLWRGEVRGSLALPPGQGAVIVCNHRGSLDPSFLYLATTRVVHWMVAREYFENPFFGFFLRRVGAIPVGRGGIDTAATKMAIRCTQEGGLLGMFPEGRINSSDKLLLSARPGAAMIALRAQVPVVPCYLSGSPYTGAALSPLVTATKACLTIGQAIDLSPYYGREDDRQLLGELTKRFLREIAHLAGEDDFQPQLAGLHWKDAQ